MLCSLVIAANGWSVISVIAALTGAAIAFMNSFCSVAQESGFLAGKPQEPSEKTESLEVEEPMEESSFSSPKEAPATFLKKEYFRTKELERIMSALEAGSSMLVIGGEGTGKSVLLEAVVRELTAGGFEKAVITPSTTKTMLLSICSQLDIDTESLEGKALTVQGLQRAIGIRMKEKPAFILCDDADQLAPGFRRFLESLLVRQEVPMLLMSDPVSPKDIFLKLPRLELEPLSSQAIRAIAAEYAAHLGAKLTPAKYAQIVARAAGIPMLACKAVEEEFLGLEPSYDHTQWVDGTPYLIVGILILTLSRVIGTATSSATLIAIGMSLTIGLRIVQTLLYSLPKQSKKLGG